MCAHPTQQLFSIKSVSACVCVCTAHIDLSYKGYVWGVHVSFIGEIYVCRQCLIHMKSLIKSSTLYDKSYEHECVPPTHLYSLKKRWCRCVCPTTLIFFMEAMCVCATPTHMYITLRRGDVCVPSPLLLLYQGCKCLCATPHALIFFTEDIFACPHFPFV